MKFNIIKNTCLSLFVLLVLFSCGSNSSENKESKNDAPVSRASAPTAAFLYITDSTNRQVVEIAMEPNGNSKIVSGNEIYFGEKKGDKLKYYDQQDNFRYEIKYKDTSFKLRNSNSELLWKVKTYDNKIKFSDNEEMENPFEIKLKNAQKIVIYKNGEEIRTVRIDSGKIPMNIANQYFSTGFKNNYHVGVLMIDELSSDEKFMLLTELNR